VGRTILIIEDEQNIADLIKDRLDDEGYKTDIAFTGGEALNELAKNKPDMITLDIYLPDINGLKILKDLKANPNTDKIPVIIISSSDEEKNAMDLGAEKFVRKPINFTKLFEILKDVESKKKEENK
jgi:DNA-binding response OmpR family regulator